MAERSDLHNSSFVILHSSFKKGGSEINHENKHNLKWFAKNDTHGAG
jgi:hypothetical protein